MEVAFGLERRRARDDGPFYLSQLRLCHRRTCLRAHLSAVEGLRHRARGDGGVASHLSLLEDVFSLHSSLPSPSRSHVIESHGFGCRGRTNGAQRSHNLDETSERPHSGDALVSDFAFVEHGSCRCPRRLRPFLSPPPVLCVSQSTVRGGLFEGNRYLWP